MKAFSPHDAWLEIFVYKVHLLDDASARLAQKC